MNVSDGSKISNLDIDDKSLSPEPHYQNVDNFSDKSPGGPKKTTLDGESPLHILENLDTSSVDNDEPGESSFSDDEGTYDLNLSSEKESLSSECESLSSSGAKTPAETIDVMEPEDEVSGKFESRHPQNDELSTEKVDVSLKQNTGLTDDDILDMISRLEESRDSSEASNKSAPAETSSVVGVSAGPEETSGFEAMKPKTDDNEDAPKQVKNDQHRDVTSVSKAKEPSHEDAGLDDQRFKEPVELPEETGSSANVQPCIEENGNGDNSTSEVSKSTVSTAPHQTTEELSTSSELPSTSNQTSNFENFSENLSNESHDIAAVKQSEAVTKTEESAEDVKHNLESLISDRGPRLALRLEGKWSVSEKDKNISNLVSHPDRKSFPTERRQKTQTPKSRTRDASPMPTQKQVFKFDMDSLNIPGASDRQNKEKFSKPVAVEPLDPAPKNPLLPLTDFPQTQLEPVQPVRAKTGPNDTKFSSSVQVSFGLNTKQVKQPITPNINTDPWKQQPVPGNFGKQQTPANFGNRQPVAGNTNSKQDMNGLPSKTAAVSFLSKTIQGEIEKERSTPTSSSGAASPSTNNSIDDELRAFSPQLATKMSMMIAKSQQIAESDLAKFSLTKSKSSLTESTNHFLERAANSISNVTTFSSSPKRDILLTSPPPYGGGKKAFKTFYNLNSSNSSLASTNKFKKFQRNFESFQQPKLNSPGTPVDSPFAHAPVYAQTCRYGPPVSRRQSLESIPPPSLDKYLEKLVKARSPDPPSFWKSKTAGSVPVGLAHKQIRSPEPIQRGSPVPTVSSQDSSNMIANLSREGSVHSLVSNTSDNSSTYKRQNYQSISRFSSQQMMMNPLLPASGSTFSIQSSTSVTPAQQPNYVSRDMFGPRVQQNVLLRSNMGTPQTPAAEYYDPRTQSYQSINVSRNAMQNTQFRIEKDRIQVLYMFLCYCFTSGVFYSAEIPFPIISITVERT